MHIVLIIILLACANRAALPHHSPALLCCHRDRDGLTPVDCSNQNVTMEKALGSWKPRLVNELMQVWPPRHCTQLWVAVTTVLCMRGLSLLLSNIESHFVLCTSLFCL